MAPLGAIKLRTISGETRAAIANAPEPKVPLPPLRVAVTAGRLVVNLVLALFLLLVLGAGLVGFVNEGRFDRNSFSAERWKAVFAGNSPTVAVDVSNGLYETATGRPVFFVRGEVRNRSQSPVRVRVRAEILDGDRSIGAAEAMAGASPSPEQLYALRSAEELQALAGDLARTATALAPGQRGAFVVAFYDYPHDLESYRLRVTLADAGTGETTAR